MTAKKITPALFVSEQVLPQDTAALSTKGFKAIICNLPDGEGADPPSFAEIETATQGLGIQAVYLPIVAGKVTDADALAFGAAMDSLPKPILAFCRTGTRSATLWSLSEAGRGRPLPDIFTATKGAGYDMSGVVRRIANGGHPDRCGGRDT